VDKVSILAELCKTYSKHCTFLSRTLQFFKTQILFYEFWPNTDMCRIENKVNQLCNLQPHIFAKKSKSKLNLQERHIFINL